MRIALITGASRGIGAAVAARYAAEGIHVILVARSTKGLEATDDLVRAAGGEATIVPLDLHKHDMIDELAASIYQRFGRLDILVGNAAMLGGLSPLPHYKVDAWNNVISLNLTANWRLLRAFDGLLKTSESGRAMFVTSGVTKAAHPYWAPYAASKAALEMMVKTYAEEVAFTKVKANLIDPGVVATDMRAEAFPGEKPATLKQTSQITDIFLKLASPDFLETGKLFAA